VRDRTRGAWVETASSGDALDVAVQITIGIPIGVSLDLCQRIMAELARLHLLEAGEAP
jgi:hypothetical protein